MEHKAVESMSKAFHQYKFGWIVRQHNVSRVSGVAVSAMEAESPGVPRNDVSASAQLRPIPATTGTVHNHSHPTTENAGLHQHSV